MDIRVQIRQEYKHSQQLENQVAALQLRELFDAISKPFELLFPIMQSVHVYLHVDSCWHVHTQSEP
jgi:hypothetical protein